MKISWFNRLLALATLLSWLGAAYHDVWMVASDITHHHQSSEHHHDQNSEDEEDQNSVSLPDFHAIPYLAKSGLCTPQDYKEIPTFHWSECFPGSPDISFELANAPPSSRNFCELRNFIFLHLAHRIQPNAPPIPA